MKTLPGIGLAAVTIVFVSCLFLSSGCSSLVSSTQIKPEAITTPTPSTAYYFLPLVKIHLIAERKKGADECTATITEVLTEADPRYMFTLWHEPNVFADDEVTITMGPNGLLGKVETTTEGKAGQVVLKLTELAEAVMKASAGVPMVKRAGEVAPFPFRYEAILDPDADEEVDTFNKVLKDNYKCDIKLKVDPPPIRLCRKGNGGPCVGPVGKDPTVEKRDGIFYRPALPYKIALKPVGDDGKASSSAIASPDEKKEPVIVKTVYVPNSAPIFLFNITRPAFVKYTQTIDFDNGMLKSATIKKPSEAVGFLSIPIDVAKAVVSIPSALFKFQIDNTKNELTSQKEVLDAQKNLLEAQKQLLLKEEELQKLRNN